MKAKRPTFSICIPAYNRAHHLSRLLDSIFAQDFEDFNIVICEDYSGERKAISEIVLRYSQAHPGTIAYYENEKNLGYDGNIRKLVEMLQAIWSHCRICHSSRSSVRGSHR
jgi:abequosyltransferase